ncbi:hypothetical protein PUNSTDRAFT_105138 [Punctularia strigosozonata HHB-11173 SS5]|uniref:uncharacterized protein n=1 Tax=Punctularia strigosozonata (strain HHB-11173) TaxID=741275 RepID=UPI0004417BD0|nr:uncharacterized protein PUNSTDRAFT_105138 [Punctularia strigosozonata HHB-11173 SS5]EIN07422.1 hypothetical protein PUNSTDRAFT_105138 [Punctularia strigosozonata HHB-11173 SS5]
MIPEEPEEPSSPIAAGAPREPTPPGPSGTAESGKHSPAPLASRPAKGTLRQPSPAKESRIPRIGAKPYARPTAASGRTTKESKITTPASAPPAGKSKPAPSVVRKTARIVRVISRARTPSDDSSDKSGSGVPAAQTTAAPPRTTAVRQGRFAKPTTVAPASAPVGSLKRKREPGPPSPPPVVVARMVRPGTFTHPKTGPPKSEPPAASKRIPEVTIISPPVRTIPRPRSAAGATVSKRRTKVADPDSEIAPTAPTKAIKPQTEASVDIPPPETVAEDAATAREVVPPPVDDTEPSKVASPPAQQEQSEEPEPSSRGRRTRARSNSVTADAQQSDAQESDVEGASETRRTRRSRKPTQANDVFGPRVVSLQPKRKEPRDRSAPPNAGIFWGMTATALRALTNSNTSKNERYYATLKTEIVRKEGERPASPVMKAKTISQRQQEEKERGRQERAARRARRSEGSVAETEASSQDWDEGNVDADDLEDVPGKHRRGAGDEEDYETPHRTQQALRQGAGETEDEGKPKKRVKWDRGLFTTVCLDEVLPKPKKPQKEDLTKRGCLTPKAKTLRLDSLGNVLNTDMPLSLVPENIVVKKFIYDNDEGAEPPPEPKTPATRSKKAKT